MSIRNLFIQPITGPINPISQSNWNSIGGTSGKKTSVNLVFYFGSAYQLLTINFYSGGSYGIKTIVFENLLNLVYTGVLSYSIDSVAFSFPTLDDDGNPFECQPTLNNQIFSQSIYMYYGTPDIISIPTTWVLLEAPSNPGKYIISIYVTTNSTTPIPPTGTPFSPNFYNFGDPRFTTDSLCLQYL